MKHVHVSFERLVALTAGALVRNGMSRTNAEIVAHSIAASDRDGSPSRGVIRLPDYISSLRGGWVDGRASPRICDGGPGVVNVDACNGFAQVAVEAGRSALATKATDVGIAMLAIRDSHHYTALYLDIEPLAEQGLIAFAFVNSRSHIVPSGGVTKLFGTNPMAFACPRLGAPPLMWDQASSVMSRGDVLFAARNGRQLPPGAGLDAAGTPTTDPVAVLEGGALLPFGGHKGSLIAMTVELLAAAVTGGRFGFEDQSHGFPGARTSNAGELIVAIDPRRSAGARFGERVEEFLLRIAENGQARLPGDRRIAARARALSAGAEVPQDVYEMLLDAA
jgi:delta1-piperideine-2-carboxylate reductase